jgi:hypothetical protein
MCLADTPAPPPPAPAAPPVLEQSAPERATKTESEVKKKKVGTKAYRTNAAALGTIQKSGSLGGIKSNTPGSLPTISK